MAIVLINENIVWRHIRRLSNVKAMVPGEVRALFWFSLCPKLLGAKEKLAIWELWGSNLRFPGSPAIVGCEVSRRPFNAVDVGPRTEFCDSR
jgi:hypothetical protein